MLCLVSFADFNDQIKLNITVSKRVDFSVFEQSRKHLG